MKRAMRKTIIYTLLIFICSFLIQGAEIGKVHADTNNFHFSDFTGDYYLSRDEVGISHLKVVEKVTAEFPEYNQNKGICRMIPFTNQDGANVTLPDLTRSNIKVERNGESEPIYSIDREDNFFRICTGTEEYVLGTQEYTFEYEFEKVVTDFGDYQELYWDTNGNASVQKFDKVTARVHFMEEDDWTGKSWCYVGKYGSNNQDRCKTTEIDDGVEFSAKHLNGYENLTFDVELKPGSYVVPEPVYNYTYIWLTVAVGLLCVVYIVWRVVRFVKTRDKARHYKGFFVKPEYQPSSKYSLPEMSEIYLGKKKSVKVAMMLDLVVKKKIQFQKRGKREWDIIVKDLDGVDEEYLDLLAILNKGVEPKVEDKIELKSQASSVKLITLGRKMDNKILKDLKEDKLVEEKYTIGESANHGIGNIIVTAIIVLLVVLWGGVMVLGMLDGMLLNNGMIGKMVFEREFYVSSCVMIAVTVLITAVLNDNIHKYANHTMKGLEQSRYMDGLKLYIKMAEAERMKLLQSVKGADTSAEGIVKLYERLLPYAAVFGLEESWMEEMKEYCKVEEIEEPDYLLTGLTAAELMRVTRNAASYASTMSRAGGGSSSGYSGGGGGGFSGGGGGGGGFGGR